MINLPTPDAYWKLPPRKTQGDADARDIFVEVGAALTAWECVEIVFAEIYGVLVGGNCSTHPAHRIAQAAYGSITSHKGRLESLEEAAETFFWYRYDAPDEKADIATLLRHFEEAVSRRNYIAHGTVINFKVDQREWAIIYLTGQ